MSKTFLWIPESEWAMAPSLICSAKPAGKKNLFEISITHPNSKEVLFKEVIKAKDFMIALDKAKAIKRETLSNIKTNYEEIKHIPRPRKGKMKLKTKE